MKRLALVAALLNALSLAALAALLYAQRVPGSPRARLEFGHALSDGRPCAEVTYWDGLTETHCVAPRPSRRTPDNSY